MPLIIVRVELHGATEQQYELLHAAMAKLGFSRYITDFAGGKFQLPTAEYAINSSLSASAIRVEVSKVAKAIGNNPWILVSKTSETDWELHKVN